MWLGSVGFMATGLYWPGVFGAATTPRWAALFALVPWLIRDIRLNAANVLGGLLLLWSALSIAWTPAHLDGMGQLFLLLFAATMFLYGQECDDLQPLWIGAGLGLWLSSAVAISQWLGFHPVPELFPDRPPAGLFINGNYLAEAAALVVVGAASARLWWLIPGVLPALLLPHSRAALVAVLAAFLAWLLNARQAFRAIAALVAAVIVAGYVVGDRGMVERIQIWESSLFGLSLFGHGLGSFWTLFQSLDLRSHHDAWPEYAHNEFLHAWFELGIPGLALLAGLCFSLTGPVNTERLVLVALIVEACFAFPFHLPATAVIGFIAAGHALRNRAVLRSGAYDGRRIVRESVATWDHTGSIVESDRAGGAGFSVRAAVPFGRHPQNGE